MTKLDSVLKSRGITLPTKVHLDKAMVFPVVIYGCESWTIKKAECRRIDAFKLWCWRRLKSPLDCKEIQPVYPKGNKSWIVIGRTDAEAETNTLATWCEELTDLKWPWCWEWLKAGEGDNRWNGMIGWHHWLRGHELEWTPGVGDGQGRLACCSPWGLKESDTTEQLNWAILHNFTYWICLESCCAWKFKLGIKPPYDPAIPLLGIYPEETKIEKDTWIPCSLQHYLQ